MELPDGAVVAKQEYDRISAALDALEKDAHAPRTLTITVTLHVHQEYPKAVTIGKDEDGNAIQKIAQNADEEQALLVEAK